MFKRKPILKVQLLILRKMARVPEPPGEETVHTITSERLHMRIGLPRLFSVIKRDTPPGDPVYEKLKISRALIAALFQEKNLLLLAVNEITQDCIFVAAAQSGLKIYNRITEADCKQIEQGVYEAYQREGIEPASLQWLKCGQAMFLRAMLRLPTDRNAPGCLAYTAILGGQAVKIMFRPRHGGVAAQDETVMRRIVDNLKWNVGANLSEEAAVYTDKVTNLQLTVPAGWKTDFHIDLGEGDVQTFSRKEDGRFMGHAGIPAGKYLRPLCFGAKAMEKNSPRMKSLVAGRLGVPAKDVTMAAYQGRNYYKCALKKEAPGISGGGQETALVHVYNGFLHLFLFSGSQTDKHYRDFEALVNSAVYGGLVVKPVTYIYKPAYATVQAPDGYDVIANDNPASYEVYARHQLARMAATSGYNPFLNDEMRMIPMTDHSSPPGFHICLCVRNSKDFSSIGDARHHPKGDAWITDRLMLIGFDTENCHYHETDSALFYVFDMIEDGQQRYITFLSGRLIDIHAKRRNGPLTPKDQRDLLFVVDHFEADPYAPQA